MKRIILYSIFTGLLFLNCGGEDKKRYPEPPDESYNMFNEEIKVEISKAGIEQYTVFSAGDENVYAYRIPTLATTKSGILIAAAEARRTSWTDKSPTDIVVKRSVDNGRTWSAAQFVTNGSKDKFAFMDPCLVADFQTGKIFLFTCRWPETQQDATANTAFLLTSDDDGVTWSEPIDVHSDIVISGGFIHGFGPGSGIQMKGGKYKNRLIVPTRQINIEKRSRNRTVYSDNGGQVWQIGEEAPRMGEFQIAETPHDILYYNLRTSTDRRAAYSSDGGYSWGSDILEMDLPGVEGGCHGSVFGEGDIVLYSGIQGGTADSNYDNRCKLTLYRSTNSAQKWGNRFLLYEKAAGYSCISRLNDGRIAVFFEAGEGQGFIKSSTRPAGWMRLDLIIVPKEVLTKGHWFKN